MSGDSGANSCHSFACVRKSAKNCRKEVVKGQKLLGKGYVSAIDAILFQKGLEVNLNQSGVAQYH